MSSRASLRDQVVPVTVSLPTVPNEKGNPNGKSRCVPSAERLRETFGFAMHLPTEATDLHFASPAAREHLRQVRELINAVLAGTQWDRPPREQSQQGVGNCSGQQMTSGRQSADLVDGDSGFREPDVAIWSSHNGPGFASRRWNWVFGDDACGGDATDLVGEPLGEPKGAVPWPGGDACRYAGSCRKREVSKYSGGANAANLVAVLLSKPKVAVWSSRNVVGRAGGSRNGEFGDDACGGDAADLVDAGLGEPKVAVRPCRNAIGMADGGWNLKLGDGALGGNAADPVAAVFREP
jgi:hypothetical protein